jgi:serine/threonine protein phosphatase PrpC
MISYSLAAATTIGLAPQRTTNQDAYGCLAGRLDTPGGPRNWAAICVADGMGGMEAGEVASEVAVKATLSEAAATFAMASEYSPEEHARAVRSWPEVANDHVRAALQARDASGGCTLVCACLIDRQLAISHVGDCRCYRLRGNDALQLTKDHSLAMDLALQGEIPLDRVRRHPGRNQLTRSLGDGPAPRIDTLETVTQKAAMELEPGDIILLCSDGLWEPVLEQEMLNIVRYHEGDLDAAANTLVSLSLHSGAPDNATVVLLQVNEGRLRVVSLHR